MSTMTQPLYATSTLVGKPKSRPAEDGSSERRQQKMPTLYSRGTAGRMPQVHSRARQEKKMQTRTGRRHLASSKSTTRSSSKSKSSSKLLFYGRFVLLGMAVGIAVAACTHLLKRMQQKTPELPAHPEGRTAPGQVPGVIFRPTIPEREDLTDQRPVWWSAAPGQDETLEIEMEALGGTRAVFHGRSSRDLGYTPPFEPNAKEVSACVDAGNGHLWIGGGGINGEIASQLLEAASRHGVPTNISQLARTTSEIHTEALKRAKQHRGTLVRLDSHQRMDESPFHSVFAYVPRRAPTWNEQATGPNVASVFIDVLNRSYAPHGNAQNMYVVYAVPPHGSAPDADFMAAYGETYKSIVAAVTIFNQVADIDARIQRLRIPLLSAGVFAHGRSPRDLGSQAMEALSSAVPWGGDLPILDFAWESTGAFFEAARALEEGRTL